MSWNTEAAGSGGRREGHSATGTHHLQQLHRLLVFTMKLLALVCAVMVLSRAAALPVEKAENDQEAKSDLVKRDVLCPNMHLISSSFGRRCFYYVPTPMSWARAESNCKFMGGNLASVHSLIEYRAIQNLIKHVTHEDKEAWIGGSDVHEENHWTWSDGTPFSYLNWCPGEPYNSDHQNCMRMNYPGEKCWDDYVCSYKMPSVCATKV